MTATFSAHNLLKKNGDIFIGDFAYKMTTRKFTSRPSNKSSKKIRRPYFAEGVPIEIHFHGIAQIDFSEEVNSLDLTAIDKLLEQEGILGIPTIFLKRTKFNYFLKLMQNFSNLKQSGKLANILGFALEGPVLLSSGGTPTMGSWFPTMQEWEKIAACGKKGLKYMVISPDWNLENLLPVAELLLTNGVYLSLGHCRRNFVKAAVEGIYAVTNLAVSLGFNPNSGAISVDHLFNDMPRTIKQAWRTVSERRLRSRQLVEMAIDDWQIRSLVSQIGEVPATLIQLACKGLVTLFLNFDGQHVDLQICRRVYEMVGAAGIAAMTDRIETNTFGGGLLKKAEIGTLWYQEKGIVAVGSSTLDEQMTNMRALMIPEKDIWSMCSLNPTRIFINDKLSGLGKKYMSYIDKRSLRTRVKL